MWWKTFLVVKISRKILIFARKGFYEILPTTKGIIVGMLLLIALAPFVDLVRIMMLMQSFGSRFHRSCRSSLIILFCWDMNKRSFKEVLLYAIKFLERQSFTKMLVITWYGLNQIIEELLDNNLEIHNN